MGLKQLNELFNIYNKSLSVVQPNIGEAFVCPICLQKFGREAVKHHTLTIEHVPPMSIGSAITTLTCRECNNKIGSRLQNQMKNYVIRKGFEVGLVPKEGIPARVDIQGQRLSFLIKEVARSEKGERHIKGFSLGSHVAPKVWPSNPSEMTGQKAHISLRLRSSMDAVNVAYLHSAYLVLFQCLGYPYIMQRVLDPVRKKILSLSTKGEIPHVISAPGVYLDPRDRSVEIGLLWQSLDTSCLSVIIAGELVVMPFMNDSYIKIYEILYDAYKKSKQGKPSGLKIEAAPLRIDPECKFYTGLQFEDAGTVNNMHVLKLGPIGTT